MITQNESVRAIAVSCIFIISSISYWWFAPFGYLATRSIHLRLNNNKLDEVEEKFESILRRVLPLSVLVKISVTGQIISIIISYIVGDMKFTFLALSMSSMVVTLLVVANAFGRAWKLLEL